MIFAGLDQTDSQGTLDAGVRKAIDYAKSHDLASFDCGQHPIDGEDLFVNIVEYTTTDPENRFWEAHRDYLDVHVPISGTEQIDLGFLGRMKKGEYQKDGDFQPADGEKNASVIMNPGDFLVCYPEDAHRTAVAANGQPETVKKAIFKVKIV